MRPTSSFTSLRDPVSTAETVRGWGVTDGRRVPSVGEEGEVYSAAIMLDFKSMPSDFATPP
jgi:hypothetical protein